MGEKAHWLRLKAAELVYGYFPRTRHMRKLLAFRLIAVLAGAFVWIISAAPAAPSLTGTWTFSVDLEDGGHGDPTFVLKQDGEKLSGTYSGPMGDRQVTGTVKGNQVVISFEFAHESQSGRATYTGTVDGPNAMHGTVAFKTATGEEASAGKWTAGKK